MSKDSSQWKKDEDVHSLHKLHKQLPYAEHIMALTTIYSHATSVQQGIITLFYK